MKKHIPNALTCGNLICGCIAITFALADEAWMAFLFIIAGAVFDFFDGMTARMLHVSSPIGKELDSLADDVTFGVAPSAIIFNQLSLMTFPAWLDAYEDLIPYVAFIMAAFSALRLAKFNLDERQSASFIGLPTPANALFWSSLIVGFGNDAALLSSPLAAVVLLLMVFVSSWLLVAEIPMFALKFKTWGWAGNEIKYVFLATSVILLSLLGVRAFAAIIAWYVLLSVGSNLFGWSCKNHQ